MSQNGFGHPAALFTMSVWGLTFVSTKILFQSFTPAEIMVYRFIFGLAALYILCPRLLRGTTLKQELLFAAAGVSGVFFYYLFQNLSLSYTLAANTSIIIAATPFLTAIFSAVFLRDEQKPGKLFFVGFIVAIIGIAFINLNGSHLHLNPLGDFLAFLAALSWACYSILMRKIMSFGYSNLLVTRRTFVYGLLAMIPACFFLDFRWEFSRLLVPLNLLNLSFLGFLASAICFLTWNYAIRALGAVKASVYIYLGPILTVSSAVLILKEPFTPFLALGTALTLIGLILSEGRLPDLKKK